MTRKHTPTNLSLSKLDEAVFSLRQSIWGWFLLQIEVGNNVQSRVMYSYASKSFMLVVYICCKMTWLCGYLCLWVICNNMGNMQRSISFILHSSTSEDDVGFEFRALSPSWLQTLVAVIIPLFIRPSSTSQHCFWVLLF